MTALGEWIDRARALGYDAGTAAGSWAADGNTSADHARRMLRWLDDGDPQADDYLPAVPDLSGEFADGTTPQSLVEEVTGGAEIAHEDADLLWEAWEQGALDGRNDEAERVLRSAAGDDE